MQADFFAGGVLGGFFGALVGGFGVEVGVRVPAEEEHEGDEGAERDGGGGEEVCEGRLAVFLRDRGAVVAVGVFGRRDREDGDYLRDAREHAGDRLPGHDGLGVFRHPEPGDVGEDAVLAEPGG